MKNIAIILAGGIGTRVGNKIPKQFIEIFGRPILAYTIDRFQNHPEIDSIEIVCLERFINYVNELVTKENFTKVKWIIKGGANFQESVINGINHLKGIISPTDQVLIHYGASPMVSSDIISDAIRVCRIKGNASPSHSLIYLAARRNNSEYSKEWLDRDEIICLNSPQALRFDYVCSLYQEGQRRCILDKVDPHTTSLMLALGESIFFSKNSTSNIKITTQEDVHLFEAFVLHELLKKHRVL